MPNTMERARSIAAGPVPVPDPRLQARLDLAIVQQAIRDLWLRIDGSRLTSREKQEAADAMLDAALWAFVALHGDEVFSFRQICERCGIDPEKAAIRIFAGLPDERRKEIWRALRHHRNRLLPLSWQACGPAVVPEKHPKGPRYLRVPVTRRGSLQRKVEKGRTARKAA
ncbi:MAG: hypothetical protein IT167_25725 [Bryobacterales bacterium]|nr:hypothetical protein [Bryobacterales bacterium]